MLEMARGDGGAAFGVLYISQLKIIGAVKELRSLSATAKMMEPV
jgi:hypothetical protein